MRLIFRMISRLVLKKQPFETILDRREAIEHALKTARTGDIIMILGKGHETTQTIGTQTLHFNDREVAEEILETL